MEKQKIISALRAFVNKRPGLEFANYGDVSAYRSESRAITRDKHEALRLLRDIELRDSISAQDIVTASKSAFSGRLTIELDPHYKNCGYPLDSTVRISYCVGQYFPTEYRKAVAAVCASALWDWKRDKAMPLPQYSENSDAVELFEGLHAGDWLRRSFAREYGRTIASRWFS